MKIAQIGLIFLCMLFFSGVVLYFRLKTNKEINIPIPTISPTMHLISPSVTNQPTSSPTLTPTRPVSGKKIYVKPNGNDNDDGTTQTKALKTIQKALDLAQPGETVELLSGEYYQDIITTKDGFPNKPITISGPSSAIVKGAGKDRVFEINHSYIILDGFAIDGKHNNANEKSSYRDKLIYLLGKSSLNGPNNVRILNMTIKNAGGECIRLRYFARQNEIGYNNISRCGVMDYEFNDGGKNGEGVYIGTAPEQRGDKKNPTSDVDRSNNNWIHHNTFNTQGNECVDIKEGSSLNRVEYNSCTGQRDQESGGMDSRGDNNIFTYNTIFDNAGAGVRLGGDKEDDGINNQVYNNTIRDNKSGGIKFQRKPQGKICNNTMSDNEGGNSVGSEGSEFDPIKPCD